MRREIERRGLGDPQQRPHRQREPYKAPNPCTNGRGGDDAVWHRIDSELHRRRGAHVVPGTWAALGRMIEASNQTLGNWKARGVPPKQYQAIAAALGWGVDQLLGNGEPVGAGAGRDVQRPDAIVLSPSPRWR